MNLSMQRAEVNEKKLTGKWEQKPLLRSYSNHVACLWNLALLHGLSAQKVEMLKVNFHSTYH